MAETLKNNKCTEEDWALVSADGSGFILCVVHGGCSIVMGGKPEKSLSALDIGIPLGSKAESGEYSFSNSMSGDCWARSFNGTGDCVFSVTNFE